MIAMTRTIPLARGAIVAALAATLILFSLPDATEARTKRQLCLQAAARELGHRIKFPGRYNIVVGTQGNDKFVPSRRPDLFCGFGGNDLVEKRALRRGDIAIGGGGQDFVVYLNGGRFYGGPQRDGVVVLHTGRFEGGIGNDLVGILRRGVFDGGDGRDRVLGGPDFGFDGPGTFLGGNGDDVVEEQSGGTFNGGDGTDSVDRYIGGSLVNVENCTPDDGAACP